MAIEDNTVYGLTGAQVKELPEKIEAVKGLAKVLTADDYNWPTANPDGVALWTLGAGVYYNDNGVKMYTDNASSYTISSTNIVAISGGIADIITMDYNVTYAVVRRTSTLSGAALNTRTVLCSDKVANDLTTTSYGRVLDARQGKVLNDKIGGDLSNLTTTDKTSLINAINEVAGQSGGGVTELTSEDYNYPASNPTRIATWLLPTGIYKTTVEVATNNQMYIPETTGHKTFVVFEGSEYDTITMFLAPGQIGTDYNGSILTMYDTNKSNGSSRTSYTGQVLYDTRIADNLTSTSQYNVLSAKQGKVLKDLIDSIAIRGAGAPTTSTVGEVGQLYEDGTNGVLYQLKSIDITTTPNTYNWEEVGAGGGGVTELTSADYNYDEGNTGTNNCIALWLLDEGNYRISDSTVKLKRNASTSATTFNTPPVGILIWGENNSQKTYVILSTNSQPGGFVKGAVGADGSVWTSEISVMPPEVVNTTGTSTTQVMSQNATTSMVYADPSTKQNVQIGDNASAPTSVSLTVAIGTGPTNRGPKAQASGAVALGAYSVASGLYSIALEGTASANGAVAIGWGSSATSVGQVAFNTTNPSYGYNSSNYRLLTGLYDGQSAHDAATYGQVISYSAINGAGAPTTATEGKYVGQLYYDTTNEAMYFLKTIDTTTTPATYTWETLGGGSSVNVVQTTGTSTTDVMSQNAVTSMVFPNTSALDRIRIVGMDATSTHTIGANSILISPNRRTSDLVGTEAVAIGHYSSANGQYGVALGGSSQASAQASVAFAGGAADTIGVMQIGLNQGPGWAAFGYNNSPYRLLTGLYDPQSAHDAATKGYVDSVAPTITMTTTDPGEGAPLAANQFIGVYQ